MSELPFKNPNVVFRRVGDGAVLLSTKDEVYFGLSDVGAHIWELLPPTLATPDKPGPDTREAICGILQDRHPETAPGTIASDLSEFIEDLLGAGLLICGEDVSAAGDS